MSLKSVRIIAVTALVLVFGALVPAPSPASEGGSSTPRWGITVRGGVYGVPDWILDMLFEEHPGVDGTIGGIELRYFGASGPEGVFSMALTVDAGTSDGEGVWQEEAGDLPVVGGGEVTMAGATLTAYLDILPSAALHPYIGLGLGAGYAEATYVRDGEEITVEEYVPVIHLPAGLRLDLGEQFALGVEGRVINGFSYGGFLQLRF